MATDWQLFDEIYAFARARALERVANAERMRDADRMRSTKSDLRMLQWAYAEAKQHPFVGPEAMDVLRARATKDRTHRDFVEDWALERKS